MNQNETCMKIDRENSYFSLNKRNSLKKKFFKGLLFFRENQAISEELIKWAKFELFKIKHD